MRRKDLRAATVAVGVEIRSAHGTLATSKARRLSQGLFYHLDLCRVCELQALERVLSMAAAAMRVLGSAVRRRMHGKPSRATQASVPGFRAALL